MVSGVISQKPPIVANGCLMDGLFDMDDITLCRVNGKRRWWRGVISR